MANPNLHDHIAGAPLVDRTNGEPPILRGLTSRNVSMTLRHLGS